MRNKGKERNMKGRKKKREKEVLQILKKRQKNRGMGRVRKRESEGFRERYGEKKRNQRKIKLKKYG